MKKIKKLISPISITLFLLLSGLFLFIYFNYDPGHIDTDIAYTYLNIEDDLVKKISQRYPEEVKDMNVSLPPHIFYFTQFSGRETVVHTMEGSGVQRIFSATCFDVSNVEKIEILGKYNYLDDSDKILEKIENLNPITCTIF